MRARVLNLPVVAGAAAALLVAASGASAARPPIAFERVEGSGSATTRNVFTAEPPAAGMFQVTHDPAPKTNRAPDWAPKRNRMVFVSDRGGLIKLWTIRADGTGLKRLTKGEPIDDDPSWSPNGKRIAFARLGRVVGGEDVFDVYTIRRDGTHLHRVSQGKPEASAPDWSPAGDRIAFLRGANSPSQVFTMRPDGTGLRKLTSVANGAAAPSWSPNGKLIAFATNVGQTSKIFVVPAAGGPVRKVTHGQTTFDIDPAWSPSSHRIVFTTARAGVPGTAIDSIAVDGSDRRQLLGDPSGRVRFGSPSWG